MNKLPESLARLTSLLGKLPSVGSKTAERLAYFLVHAEPAYVDQLGQALREVKSKVRLCDRCYDITEQSRCAICANPQRDATRLCVVERSADLRAMESVGKYRGLYHVLHGTISPLDGSGPETLKVRELMERLAGGGVQEIILAMNHNVEGDATALYLVDLLRQRASGVQVTRLATGIPIGGALAYADQATLERALAGRARV